MSHDELFGWAMVSRASIYCSEETSPCDDAVRKTVAWVDRRTVDDPMKNKYIGSKWYDHGRNHRVENGMIARDIDREEWCIRIDSADDLLDFILRFGRVVVEVSDYYNPPCFDLTIYDGYIE